MIHRPPRKAWRRSSWPAMQMSSTYGQLLADRDRLPKGSRAWRLVDHAARALELAIRAEVAHVNRGTQ